MLRALQIGLRIEDLFLLEEGEVIDMLIESGNDSYDYPKIANQEDFNNF